MDKISYYFDIDNLEWVQKHVEWEFDFQQLKNK
jgi:hypothetical protein